MCTAWGRGYCLDNCVTTVQLSAQTFQRMLVV
jgi:hypothetical protein